MNDSLEFENFVRRHQDMVFGMAVRMLADPSEAEDISQTVFLKALRAFRCPTALASGCWLAPHSDNEPLPEPLDEVPCALESFQRAALERGGPRLVV